MLNIAVLQIPVHYQIIECSVNAKCKHILPPTDSLRFTPQRLNAVGKNTDVSYDANSHVLDDTNESCVLTECVLCSVTTKTSTERQVRHA